MSTALLADTAGAWIAAGSALAVGLVAGFFQIRSVTRQQATAERANVLTGYDQLVEDLQSEVSTARAEAREARVEAAEARKQANDAHAMFYECELRSHDQYLQIRSLHEGLEDLRKTVSRYHDAFGPDPKGFENQQSFWPEPEGEGDNT